MNSSSPSATHQRVVDVHALQREPDRSNQAHRLGQVGGHIRWCGEGLRDARGAGLCEGSDVGGALVDGHIASEEAGDGGVRERTRGVVDCRGRARRAARAAAAARLAGNRRTARLCRGDGEAAEQQESRKGHLQNIGSCFRELDIRELPLGSGAEGSLQSETARSPGTAGAQVHQHNSGSAWQSRSTSTRTCDIRQLRLVAFPRLVVPPPVVPPTRQQ